MAQEIAQIFRNEADEEIDRVLRNFWIITGCYISVSKDLSPVDHHIKRFVQFPQGNLQGLRDASDLPPKLCRS